MPLHWVKSTQNDWLGLHRFDLSTVTTEGVYIIWHGGNPSQTVYVGQGDIAARLTAHRNRIEIQAYNRFGLYVTWATVPAGQRDGVERFLADTLNPLVGDAHPTAAPIPVNLPW